MQKIDQVHDIGLQGIKQARSFINNFQIQIIKIDNSHLKKYVKSIKEYQMKIGCTCVQVYSFELDT
ncbi:unnamed protein product [Paramecium octaurelia]|uniref:Uncharacterized protein n=1 Tax=Paramecium octaurelia TaxID=43137 RepID=A0A8S1WT32_PAROT|nr:unnamed protein product [Paramecium octaurelia]CAD8188866.1 unnamed protein product [Paramecium octaurelia]